MKKREPIYEFNELYDDLNSVFKAVLKKGHFKTQFAAIKVAVNRPSRRFWVSPERLSEVVNAIETDGDTRLKGDGLRFECYSELYRRYVAYKAAHPEMTKIEICSELVYQPAPKFYMNASWAEMIIRRGRKEEKQKSRNNLNRRNNKITNNENPQ